MQRSVFHRGALPTMLAIALCSCGGNEPARLQGYVEGEFVYLSAPVAGALQTLEVGRGAHVERGDKLFAIEATPIRAQRDTAQARLLQAQAALQDAQKGLRPSELASLQAQLNQAVAAQALAAVELTRQQKLFVDARGSSQQDVDRARTARDQASEQVAALTAQLQTARLGARNDLVASARANVDALQAQLAQAEWELAQTAQSAPTGATVTDTLYRTGEWVAAGHPVAVLLPPGNIKVRTYVPQESLTALKLGGKALVYIDGREQAINGAISFISPTMEFTPPVVYSQSMRSKLVALVEIVFDDATAVTLHPGQPVDVAFVN